MTRRNLGHSVSIMLKLHPDLKAYLDRRAEEEFCTVAEFLRRLVLADMRRNEKT